MNFVGGPVVKSAVPPITETVTATVLALAGAAPLGTARRIVPLVRSTSRAPALRLKIVFAPSRVIVRSVNVSSARDSFPVRTALCNVTLSFTTAGRGAPCASNNRTSSIICETRASCNGAATANGAATKNQGIHQRAIDLSVKVLGRNLFISTSYCDARAASGLGFGAGCAVAGAWPTSDHVIVTRARKRRRACRFTSTAGGLFEAWLLLGQAFFTLRGAGSLTG